MSGLGEFITSQRWFRSRTRVRTETTIVDAVPIADLVVLLVRMRFVGGPDETYVTSFSGEQEAPASLAEHLIASMRRGGCAYRGVHGSLIVSPGLHALADLVPGVLSRAEQTNTSVRFGEQAILKLYRSVSVGPNPEVEILRYLADNEDVPTPRLVGEVNWVRDGAIAGVAMAQSFVPSRGDAWSVTLEALEALVADPCDAALGREEDRARRLGLRTAALHRALAAPTHQPAFAPEPVTSLLPLAPQIERDLARVSAKLSRSELDPSSIVARVKAVCADPIHAVRTRTHGDYHLGQVLVTPEDDFVIIDFEGEPARPLVERRQKGLALRDVAGMLRSLAYAAATMRKRRVSPVIDAWETAASVAFLDGWLSGVADSPAAPVNEDEARRILQFFLIEKAIYEISYELNHRPEWVDIPLSGLRALMR